MAEYMSQFNWVDYIFIAVFVISILGGIARGLLREVLALIVLVAAFIVATLFSNTLAVYFTNTDTMQHAVTQASAVAGTNAAQPATYLAVGVSFALLFLGTVVIGAILNFFISLILQATVLGVGNRLLGGLFGFVRGLLINLAIVFVVQLTSFADGDVWKQSKLMPMFIPAAKEMSKVVAPTFDDLKKRFETQEPAKS